MRRLCAAFLVAVACGALQLTQAVADTSCAAVQYLDALQRADAAVSAVSPDPAAAAGILGGLVRSERTLERTLAPIIDDLDATPARIAAARASLDAQVEVLALPPGAACNVDSGPASAALKQVYDSPVFAGLDQMPQEGWLAQALNWIASLFNSTGRTLGTAGSILLGGAALTLVVALAAWRLRGVLGSATASMVEAPEEGRDDPVRQWELAERAAARGDHREAIRRAFRSALLDAAGRGRLSVDASWTTRELLAAARGDADLVAALAPAAAVFDRAWYSGDHIGVEDWHLARTRCEALRSIARSRAPERAA